MTSQDSVSSLAHQADAGAWPKMPWLAIWVQPRTTIRAIVDSNAMRHVALLAALTGITNLLQQASNRNWGDTMSLLTIFLIVLVAGPVAGIISVYFSGAFLAWTGSWFDGKATAAEVRAAVAWSALPTIAAAVVWLPQLALYGDEMFSSVAPRIAANPWGILCFTPLQIILALWAFVLLLKTLAEVHRFSTLKAFGAVVLPGLALGLLLFGCFIFLPG